LNTCIRTCTCSCAKQQWIWKMRYMFARVLHVDSPRTHLKFSPAPSNTCSTSLLLDISTCRYTYRGKATMTITRRLDSRLQAQNPQIMHMSLRCFGSIPLKVFQDIYLMITLHGCPEHADVRIRDINGKHAPSSTYDHRSVKTGHPVRSAIHKH
jgi:hypothetical protein